ncbi:MAG: winged helix DNA-binding protein [Pseudomonadota bacterium]
MTMLAHSQYAATALAETNLVDGDEDFSLESAHASYLGALGLVERLHRLQLDLIKDEFERLGRGDINSVQALLVFNIADEELTAGELKTRGHYQGSNVSYNLKKLVEGGFIHQERSATDRRSVRIRLTEKGQEVRRVVAELHTRHLTEMVSGDIASLDDLELLQQSMRRLENYWRSQIRYIY